MAEQLRFEQVLGNRAAVERDEALVAARARLVNGARHHFLPGAGLAGDEHGRAARRHRLDHLRERAHRRAAADDPRQAVALLELLAQVRIFRSQAPLFERRFQHVQQFFELERLADEVGGAALDGIDGVLHRAVAGDHDADDAGVPLQRGGEHLAAVDAGQTEVRDEDVEREPLELFEGLFTGRRLDHRETGVGQALGHHGAKCVLVVDEQDVIGFSHGCLGSGGVNTLTGAPPDRQP